MKRTALALTLALTLLISSVSIVPPARSTPRTIIVPDNFATIPEAVRNATAGDTVYVRAGNYTITSEGYTSGILYYFVGLAIDTPISLIGENCSNTVISIVVDNPTPSDIGIAVSADNVTISGFTIMGRNVVISLGGYSTLTNNIIKQTTGGSAIGAGYGSMVSSNIIEGAGYGTGIVANSYTNISNNIIKVFQITPLPTIT